MHPYSRRFGYDSFHYRHVRQMWIQLDKIHSCGPSAVLLLRMGAEQGSQTYQEEQGHFQIK